MPDLDLSNVGAVRGLPFMGTRLSSLSRAGLLVRMQILSVIVNVYDRGFVSVAENAPDDSQAAEIEVATKEPMLRRALRGWIETAHAELRNSQYYCGIVHAYRYTPSIVYPDGLPPDVFRVGRYGTCRLHLEADGITHDCIIISVDAAARTCRVSLPAQRIEVDVPFSNIMSIWMGGPRTAP